MSTFEADRAFLERLAYQMLGSLAEAEDVVQDSYLRWHRAGEPVLESPRPWLARTCTRLCLDRLKSARRTRELYVGPWLPEPRLDDPRQGDPDRVEIDESISMALMYTLERLRPAERAVFLLHDVFDYEFAQVADILGHSPANCRQLAVRARQHLAAGVARDTVDRDQFERLSRSFFAAIRSGDVDAIRGLLAEEVVVHSDGGGKALAARKPFGGPDRVARFFQRSYGESERWSWREAYFNGALGLLVEEDDKLVTAMQLQVHGGRIEGVFIMRNPDKLAALAGTSAS